MYKFSNHLSNGKLVLVRKKICEGTCALVVMKAPRRSYASPKPHPKASQPPESHPFFWGTVGVSVLTGAAIVYCKNDSDARNWLATNAPWADNFIALVYQENTTYGKAFSNKVYKITSSISDFAFGREGISPSDMETRDKQDLDKGGLFVKKEYELPPPSFEPLYVEEKVLDKPEIESPATLVQTDKCEPQKPPPVVITKDLVELEHDMHEATKAAIDNYKKATTSCASYNVALHKIVEASVSDLDNKLFAALAGSQGERDAALIKAKEACAKARCSIETLDRLLNAGVKAPPEAVASTRRYIKQFRTDLQDAERKYHVEVEKSVISDKYWHKVETARNMYKDELQMLFPGIDLQARQLTLKGDTDLLLLYTLKQVQFLQNELAEIQTIRESKLSRAIECHDEKEIIEAKVEDVLKRERVEKEREYQKKSLIMQAEADKQLREQLKKQMEVQAEVLKNMLEKKEKEVLGRFSKKVSEQVEKERVVFKQELAAMAGKMTAIENTLKQRAKAEADTKKSQTLWAAAEALLAATRRGVPETSVANEIRAIERAGQGDKLVQTVIKGLPADTLEKSVVTENSLRERYDMMEKTAMKVALVGKNGASLPVYFLSWIQSKLLFSRISEIPEDELENKPRDFTSLDTFEILHRARYYMEHGDLPSALRYVNLLQGAARAASRAWCQAARGHLEVRQAAEAVMAHAAAASLLSLGQLAKQT